MRVLMASSSPYLPATGGAYKANRLVAQQLVARGHCCHVIALARTALTRTATLAEFQAELTARGMLAAIDGLTHRFEDEGVVVHAVDGAHHIRDVLAAQIRGFEPDLVLVSTEDWRQVLLATALEAAPDRVVYVAHTLPALPFGPYSADPNPAGAVLLGRVRAIVAASGDLARYFAEHAAATAPVEVIYPPVYGVPPFPLLGRADNPFVTMINPCPLKGIEIFLSLARAFPEQRFAAVPGWGTGAAERAALAELGVTLLSPSERIDDFLSLTRVLVNPTLTPFGLPLTVVEGMLRGIPVLASDIGGLREAGLAGRYTLPVRPVAGYGLKGATPIATKLPAQDAQPWIETLRELDEASVYAAAGATARAEALRFVAGVDVSGYERLLDARRG
jgi:glycosyltransferase involved in cell wall biosynthesis